MSGEPNHPEECWCDTCYLQTLESFVEQIRDGFDCDPDSHKYNTLCRCCSAEALLNKENPYAIQLKPLPQRRNW